MAATVLRKRFTVDDYYRMAETGILSEGDRVELIDGEVVAMTPEGPRHGASATRAVHALIAAVGPHALVRVGNPLRLDRFNEPQPDLALVRPRADFYASAHPGPGDVLLVVEIAHSSLRYDRSIKARVYAAWGVPEYWIADLESGVLWRYASPEGSTYKDVTQHHREESLSPQLIPGCVVPVEAFLLE